MWNSCSKLKRFKLALENRGIDPENLEVFLNVMRKMRDNVVDLEN